MLEITHGQRLGIILACASFLVIALLFLACKACRLPLRYTLFHSIFSSKYMAPNSSKEPAPKVFYDGANVPKQSSSKDTARQMIKPDSMSLSSYGGKTEEWNQDGVSPTTTSTLSLSITSINSTSSTSLSNQTSPAENASALQYINLKQVNESGMRGGSGFQHESEKRQQEEYRQYSGSIHFSLHYDTDKENLTIILFQARDLPPNQFSGTADPYVKIRIFVPEFDFSATNQAGSGKSIEFQTRVHRRTLDPVFDETFVCNISYSEVATYTVLFTVCDYDKYSRYNLIGEVEQPIGVTDFIRGHMKWVDLKPTKEHEYRGELLLSLSYLPTAERLSIVILKARNLRSRDPYYQSYATFVKVTLKSGGKKVKRKKTTVRQNSQNPVYNEPLSFDVPVDQLDKVTFIISVCSRHEHESTDHRESSSHVIGRVAVGENCSGLGHNHWVEMIKSPRKSIAQWHYLLY